MVDSVSYLNNFINKPDFKRPKLSFNEKTVLLFMLVKIFFLPLMLNFLFSNLHHFKIELLFLINSSIEFNFINFINLIYPLLLPFLFIIDTLYFSFGYAVESKFLNNEIRSVEPTLFGWVVALICYPPLSGFSHSLFNWHASSDVIFSTT